MLRKKLKRNFHKIFLGFLLLIIFCSNDIFPQFEREPFTKLISRNGVEVSFIFYREGNGVENNGVVIFLNNKNNYEMSFSFNLIFRSVSEDRQKNISGLLKANEKRTGSSDSLYFIPFKDKRAITEVGIKVIQLAPKYQ